MGSFSSGLTSITGNVTSIASNTPITASLSGARTGVGTTTLGTVGAGKIWKIISATLIVAHTSAVSTASLIFKADTYASSTGSNAANMAGGSIFLHWDYGACPKLVAGDTITLVTSAGQYANATVQYIEESA